MDKKIFARAPNTGMWLGQDPQGAWRAYQDFGKAWAFDESEMAREAWDQACRLSMERCVKSGEEVPAWVGSRPVFLWGRTPEGMPGSFEYYLGIIDGRFVSERPSGMSLTTDESQAKVFGSLDEAKAAVMGLRTAKCKSLAVLPMSCKASYPIEIEGAKLDALASASYAKSLKEEWESLVGASDTPPSKSKSL